MRASFSLIIKTTDYFRCLPSYKQGLGNYLSRYYIVERKGCMKLKTVENLLNARILTSELDWEDVEVETACGADLMSDVLAFAKEKSLLLTGLVYPQVIRTCEILDIKAIVFVRGKVPPPELIEMATEYNLPLMATSLPMYQACGRLYQKGLGNGEGEFID